MSIQSKELRKEAATKAEEARSIFDSINDKTSDGDAKEKEAQFDALMVEHDQLIANAERAENLEAAEKRAKEGLRGNPNGVAPEHSAEDDASTVSYREAFFEAIKAGGDVTELPSEVREILRKGIVEVRAQNTTTGPAGGYFVPTELSRLLIETMEMHGPMYNGQITTEIITNSGHEIDVPTLDDTGDSSTASKAESAGIPDDNSGDITLGQKKLNAYVFATPFVKWSMEMGQDSIHNVEQLLNRLLGRRLGKLANIQLTTGTGTNAPHGIVTAAGAGLTAAGATSIVADEILELEHSVDPAYRSMRSCGYMMNDKTLLAVRKLKDGQGNYLWQKGDVQKGTPQTLNGYQVIINQAMVDIATGVKPMLFGDFAEYYVRKVGSPMIGVLRERFWPSVGMAGLIRFDGELGDDAAIKALLMA